MKGLIALLVFGALVAVFFLGTKVGAIQQAAAWPPRMRIIHEYRAKCINVKPKGVNRGKL